MAMQIETEWIFVLVIEILNMKNQYIKRHLLCDYFFSSYFFWPFSWP